MTDGNRGLLSMGYVGEMPKVSDAVLLLGCTLQER